MMHLLLVPEQEAYQRTAVQVVGWHGSGADGSEAEEEESIYSEEESGSEAADDF